MKTLKIAASIIGVVFWAIGVAYLATGLIMAIEKLIYNI